MSTQQGPSLIDDVRTALVKRNGRFTEISRLTGISYSWLQKFSVGKFPNASYVKLKTLADLFASGTI
jgi:hypothetical protein